MRKAIKSLQAVTTKEALSMKTAFIFQGSSSTRNARAELPVPGEQKHIRR
jgi:hypothetical protein